MDSAVVVGVGALEGVGAAVSRRLAREGLHVFVSGRTTKRLNAVVELITSEGGTASPVKTDASKPDDIRQLFNQIEEMSGSPPQVVIYNAGNNFPKDILEISEDEFESSWRTSGFGAFLCGREAARRMVPNGGGTLIFTGAYCRR